jgi:hypothetical protein
MNDFRAVNNYYQGPAKSHRYAIRITPSGTTNWLNVVGYSGFMKDFTYLCEAAEMPGRGFMNVDQRYYGPNFKVPFQTSYEDVNFTFICRAESYERQFFDDWMEIINPTTTFDFNYRDDYSSRIDIYQYGEIAEKMGDTAPQAFYSWTLHDAYPVNISPQQVTWTDENFQRLSVTFTYTRWTRENRDIPPGTYSLVNGKNVVMNDTQQTTTPDQSFNISQK